MSGENDIVVLFSTAPPGGAGPIAKSVVEKRLAACVNILPVQSVFRWKGDIQEEAEELMIVKTRKQLVPALTAEVKRLHTYEIPEVIVLPVDGGYPAYLEWVGEETAV
ncbi:MAG: divalent-cation tolerance protein CutA [Methanoregulaceae archaeon]|nr:divalent-cation tolerance protein CutA [Methanoregulaceae archaeon]